MWLNDGTGTFGAPLLSTRVFTPRADAGLPVGALMGNPGVADMNADGHPDLVAIWRGVGIDDYVVYAPGDGAGHFGPIVELFSYPWQTDDGDVGEEQIATPDLNHDGRPDVVLLGLGGNNINLAPPAGGLWSSPTTVTFLPNNVGPFEFALGDINGDHAPDIVVGTSVGLVTLVNDGSGTFTTNGPDASTGMVIYHVRVGDVDGDGNADTVVDSALAPGMTETITVRFGNGTPTPAETTTLMTFEAPRPVCSGPGAGAAELVFDLGDVTGDGKADLYMFYQQSILVSNGRIFEPPVLFRPFVGPPPAPTPAFGLLHDMNGDSKVDLVSQYQTGFETTLFNPAGYHGW